MAQVEQQKTPVTQKEIADYFGVDETLYSSISAILQDFNAIGSFPTDTVKLLSPHIKTGDVTILDLGCGKGASSTLLAKELGCRVLGVDMLPDFVHAANEKADQMGVSDRCQFMCGDIREVAKNESGHDATLLISVGSIWGEIDRTVGALRKTVKPGGLIIIDDGYAIDGEAIDFQGFDYVKGKQAMRDLLTAHGDEIAEEITIPLSELKTMNDRYNGRIAKRVAEIKGSAPHLSDALDRYVEKELEECRLMEEKFICTTWMLRINS